MAGTKGPSGMKPRSQAHRLLDAAILGADVSPDRIRWALRETGDLAFLPLRVALPAGQWERPWVPGADVLPRAGPFDGLGGVA